MHNPLTESCHLGDFLRERNLNEILIKITLTSDKEIPPAGAESIYFLRSLSRYSNTRNSFLSLGTTSSNL